MGAQTVHSERMSLGGPGQLWFALEGTITSAYAPTATGGKFVKGNDVATKVPGFSGFLPVGDFANPVSIDYAITVEEIEVENSLEVVINLVTKRTFTIKAELADLNISNWALLQNAALTSWNGTPGATGVAKFTPVDPGSEVRYQALWCAQDDTDIVVGYKVLQVGALSEKKGKGKAGQSTWAGEWKGELPPAAVSTTMYNRWMTGAGRAATVATDV